MIATGRAPCGKSGEAFQSHPDWDGLFTDVVMWMERAGRFFSRQEAVFDYDVLRFGAVCYVIHPTLFLRKAVYERLGGYKHKEFLNCCDVELILRLGRERRRIGHIPEFLVNYRIHSARPIRRPLRVARNMALEYGQNSAKLTAARRAFWEGPPPFYARALRQWQKLRYRGTCDLVPGGWRLKKHMRAKTQFSSNIGIAGLILTAPGSELIPVDSNSSLR